MIVVFLCLALTIFLNNTECSPTELQLQAIHTLLHQGKELEAQKLLQKAIAQFPCSAEAWHLLATSYAKTKNYTGAYYCYERLAHLDPSNAQGITEYATLLRSQELCSHALTWYRKALATKPDDLALLFDAGFACTMIGLVDEALSYYQHALAQQPTNIQALYNCGYCLKMADRIPEALSYYHRILTLKPDYEPARYALALSYLAAGNFELGWQWYEQYLKREQLNADRLRAWYRDNALEHKRILLRHQGGLGDTLQFIRCAELLYNKGAHLIAVVPEALHPLLRNCHYLHEILPLGCPFPDYDDQTTIMGLPAILNLTEEMMSASVPYLHADPALVDAWKNTISHNNKCTIGICWQADTFNDSSRLPVARRGIPLKLFENMLQDPTVVWYSLQQREGLEQLKTLPPACTINQFGNDFDTVHGRFMDTAAVIKNLDLVITVDTAIAHLAGGLGVPVWLLLPYSTDWRWIAHRKDSPWYPTMRIFKQQHPLRWHDALEDLRQELAVFVNDTIAHKCS